MKRFYELNADQKEKAVKYAKDTLQELMLHGVIESDRQVTREQLEEFAACAAEDAWYSERGDQIIADIADGK